MTDSSPLSRRQEAAQPQSKTQTRRTTSTSTSSSSAPFKIIVLADDEPARLQLVLESIMQTDFQGDEVELEVRICGASEEHHDFLSELVANGIDSPAAIVSKSVVRCQPDEEDRYASGSASTTASTGRIEAWATAWTPSTSSPQNALILDGNIKLSRHWYSYARQATSTYFTSDPNHNIAGIALTRQALTSSLHRPLATKPIVNQNQPFLYPLVVGSTAFIPHPQKWTEFLTWLAAMNIPEMQTTLPNFFTSMFTLPPSYQSIFFYHTRKAGGTTLRHWFTQVAQKHTKQFLVKEGRVCPSKYFHEPSKDDEAQWLYDKPQVFSVTALREPVSRIVSAYTFEGRYPGNPVQVSPEIEVSMEDWMDQTLEPTNSCSKGYHCWQCSSECYHHWFGGFDTGGYDVERAYDVLDEFDMILYFLDLKHPAFAKTLQRLFDALEIPFVNDNPTRNVFKAGLNVSHAEYERLEGQNVHDKELLEYFVGDLQRKEHIVQEYYTMLEEESVWTLWTQLFSYWCKLTNNKIVYVTPPEDEKGLGVVLTKDPSVELDFEVAEWPVREGDVVGVEELKEFDYDGRPVVGGGVEVH